MKSDPCASVASRMSIVLLCYFSCAASSGETCKTGPLILYCHLLLEKCYLKKVLMSGNTFFVGRQVSSKLTVLWLVMECHTASHIVKGN